MIHVDTQPANTNVSKSFGSEQPEHDDNGVAYLCKLCDKRFSRKDNLKRHMRVKHNVEKYDSEDVKKKSICVYPGCTKSFYHKTKLIEHIENDHYITCQTENMIFKSLKDFEKWKEQEEANHYVFFSKCSGTVGRKHASYSYYACQKDGNSRVHANMSEPQQNRCRKRRQGQVKLGTLCPARLQVKSLSSGGVIVKYIKTHSHPIKFEDTQYHPVPKAIKLEIMDKVTKGMCVKDIQESLIKGGDENEKEESFWPKKKRHFVSERSIREMRRKLKVIQEIGVHLILSFTCKNL